MKRWGNEYCHDAWRPWRDAKSCSTGDRPPTYYFSTGHRPGFWFLDAHFSTHKPPGSGTGFGTDTFCHSPYIDGHKIRGSHGIWKLHMKKCWKWGLEIHHFHFISNISYNIISWIKLIVAFNPSNATMFPHNFVGWVLVVVQKTNSSNFCIFFLPKDKYWC
jgi:hypothetical protein